MFPKPPVAGGIGSTGTYPGFALRDIGDGFGRASAERPCAVGIAR
jgi:hypothetical protein